MSSGTSKQPHVGLNQGRDAHRRLEEEQQQGQGEAWADDTFFTDGTGWVD